MNKDIAVYHFTRAGCRIPGFGNGCTTCPIRKELGTCCSGNDRAVLSIVPKLYFTNKKYRASVDIELNNEPALREYLHIGAKVL